MEFFLDDDHIAHHDGEFSQYSFKVFFETLSPVEALFRNINLGRDPEILIDISDYFP